jgi:hypothetical protein
MDAACMGDHGRHLCLLMTNPLMDDTDLDEIKKLVRDAQFICKNCGRTAKSEENLCNPVSLYR